jgi:tRNA dimethylallyltransferase
MGTHVIAVVGATATGKSGLAIALARALGGEVVNADSMQLYQGMDIGTAKEPAAAWRGVPHHLLDIWPVTRTASVADYQKLARAAIDGIFARGRVPVLAGGSGLYIRAALDDLDFHGTDPGTRARLESELAEVGAAALHARLAALDPAAAAAILPSNGRRIVRALEVIELTGRPFTATMPAYEQVRPAVQLGLTLPRPELDRRIAARVEAMWQAGFEAEVKGLVGQGLREGKTASRALGYQQMLRHLAGELTLDEARQETVRATRRFARRQESWFRRDPRVRWLDASQPVGNLLTEAMEHIRAELLRCAPYVVMGVGRRGDVARGEDTRRIWAAVQPELAEFRVEIATDVTGATALPWEIMTDPETGQPLCLRAGTMVRAHPYAARHPELPRDDPPVRVLLVISRPGSVDVPFWSVAHHLARLQHGHGGTLRLDVLRPPTFAQLTRTLHDARNDGQPYQVVHFDGHGVWGDASDRQWLPSVIRAPAAGSAALWLASPIRPGAHGYRGRRRRGTRLAGAGGVRSRSAAPDQQAGSRPP